MSGPGPGGLCVFSTVEMKRLSVVVLERDERAVLRGLGMLGAVHLVRTGAGPDTAPQEPPDRSEVLARCDNLTGRTDKIFRQLDLATLPDVTGAELPQVSLDEVEHRLQPIEKQLEETLHRREEALQRWGRVTALLDQVQAYEGLELSFDQIGRFSFLHFAIGSLPGENMAAFEKQVGENVVLMPLAEAEGRRRLVAVTSRKGRFALETALEGVGFQREAIAESATGTMRDLLEEARREKDQLSVELTRPREAIAALVRDVSRPLAVLRAVVGVERKILEAEQNFPRTESTVLINGWIPADEVVAMRRHLQNLIGGRCVVETQDPGDVPEEEIPVLVKHPRILRPFQMLVSAYGLPGYRELEPTLFVAITFLVMFGMMFGDVGHGLVLVLAGLGALVYGRKQQIRDAGVLLMAAGGASIIFGFLYGEFFGFTGEGWALWNNPLHGDTMQLLVVAMGFGVVVVSLGLVLNMINRFRRGDVIGGTLDKFGAAGAIFYWGALAIFIKAVVLKHEMGPVWYILLLAVPMTAMFLKEPVHYVLCRRAGRTPHSGNLFEAVFESAVELFEGVLSYMANTISFVRLGAYAMSHAAILYATLMMAEQTHKMAGAGLGGVLYVVILIVGNVLTIVLEGIIASVQALRLQYYEFFGKFFSGSGRAFTPFRLDTKEQDQ